MDANLETSEADRDVYRTAVSLGAPLWGWDPGLRMSLEEFFPRALVAARSDATLFRVLPLLVRRHAKRLDWRALAEATAHWKQEAALGMLLELTATLGKAPELLDRANLLRHAVRQPAVAFFPFRSTYEERLAEMRTPAAVRRWGFLMNETEDSLRGAFEKHVPTV